MTHVVAYQLQGVQRWYGDCQAVDVVDLEVDAGEILCLLGPTGAGKSTLLRLLAGLESPTAGQVIYERQWRDPARCPLAIRRRIVMVHQRPLLLTGSVRQNVEYGLRIRRRAGRAAAVDEVLDRLGLSGLAKQSAATLSGGQLQLVALARALVVTPDVLLLDEPTAHLDPACVSTVEHVVGELQTERQMTVVWATHNLFQARRVAHRVGLLLRGQLIEVAATQQFFGTPADPRTADFVQGKMVY